MGVNGKHHSAEEKERKGILIKKYLEYWTKARKKEGKTLQRYKLGA